MAPSVHVYGDGAAACIAHIPQQPVRALRGWMCCAHVFAHGTAPWGRIFILSVLLVLRVTFTNLRLHSIQNCVLRYAGHVWRALGHHGLGTCLHCRLHGTRDAGEAVSSSDGRIRSGKSILLHYVEALIESVRLEEQ